MPRVQHDEEEQLRLFEGGPDMAKLRALAKSYTGAARAANTVKAYAADWVVFEEWCRSTGRKPLPATEETVCLFAVAHLEERKVSTVERRLAAIVDAHRAAGLTPPGGYSLRDIMRGARRERGSAPVQKAALRPEDLRAICVKLQRVHTYLGVRDRALMTLGFAAALRRSEVRALDVSDVQLVRKGVLVTIRKSKTDQEGRGRQVGVFAGKRVSTCPQRALRVWLHVRGREPGALFLGRNGGGRLTGAAVSNVVKRCVKLIGLDARRYGAHSLRAGCVTAAAEAGMPDSLIMQRTGHRSVQTVSKYVRPASVFSVDVLASAM
jgi:integrase